MKEPPQILYQGLRCESLSQRMADETHKIFREKICHFWRHCEKQTRIPRKNMSLGIHDRVVIPRRKKNSRIVQTIAGSNAGSYPAKKKHQKGRFFGCFSKFVQIAFTVDLLTSSSCVGVLCKKSVCFAKFESYKNITNVKRSKPGDHEINRCPCRKKNARRSDFLRFSFIFGCCSVGVPLCPLLCVFVQQTE